MNKWHVIYRELNAGPLDFDIFECYAEDMDHADEQTLNANPDCEILWADTESDPEETMKNWFTTSMEE